MDRRAWQATVHGVAKSQTRLSNEHTTWHYQVFFCNSIEIMISSMLSMSVMSYISWFSKMKPTLYSWDIINFVIIFYACFILQNHFSNGLRFYFNMKEIIPKYFFSKSKCLIIVKSMIWLRQGCTELLRIPRGSWLKKQNTWCSCSCCRLVAVIKSD